MTKKARNLVVTRNLKLNQNYFILNLQDSEDLPAIAAGQFVELLVPDQQGVFFKKALFYL